MLPPGHIAAGYLTAQAVLHITHPVLDARHSTYLLFWGMFFGFAPDLDFFYWFIRSKSFKMDFTKGNHRHFYSHAPVLWLLAGLLIYFVAQDPFWKTFGLLVWLGSWSHFLLDTIQYGVMWLWPLSNKVYGLFKIGESTEQNMQAGFHKSFVSYWISFLKEYAKGIKISLTCELILLVITLLFYLHTH